MEISIPRGVYFPVTSDTGRQGRRAEPRAAPTTPRGPRPPKEAGAPRRVEVLPDTTLVRVDAAAQPATAPRPRDAGLPGAGGPAAADGQVRALMHPLPGNISPEFALPSNRDGVPGATSPDRAPLPHDQPPRASAYPLRTSRAAALSASVDGER
ncbi:hypothetical protein GCM10009838_63660 [Catenulispora subtropica]|uniref:Uncharacterized protein n=1 Tax=Catenulispora subtropica TaxID=450798 RepID=A0ABN2SRX1_9ACTN